LKISRAGEIQNENQKGTNTEPFSKNSIYTHLIMPLNKFKGSVFVHAHTIFTLCPLTENAYRFLISLQNI
jgi:hypothetical protein